jgi:hypothetical protein
VPPASIVGKLWNLCNVLKDDGVAYHQCVTELTYRLFFKMATEAATESQISAGYRWEVHRFLGVAVPLENWRSDGHPHNNRLS